MEEAGVRLVAEGANSFNKQIENAASSVDDFGKNAGTASKGLDLMSVATVALGSALADLALRGIDAAVGAVTGFIQSGFDFNNTLEQATAKLIAFTGSGEAAAEVLEMVRRRAAETPFAFDEMANSAAGLASISKTTGEDLEGLLGIAERLAASNPAEGLEGAAFALREAFSGDFMSLQDRFNISKGTIKRLKETGVTVENLSMLLNEMGISTQLVTGLAETFQGRLSTFQDSITNLASALTEPVFESFKTILMELQPIIEQNSEGIAKFLSEIGTGIGGRILSAWGLLRDAVITFQEAFAGDWVRNDVIHPFHDVVGIIGTVVGQFDLLGDAFGRLMEGKPIDSYIEAIVRNISTMLGFDLTNFQFQSIVDSIAGGISTFQTFAKYIGIIAEDGDELNDFLTQLPTDLQPAALAFGTLLTTLQDLWKMVETNLPTAWNNFLGQIDVIVADFATAEKGTYNWNKLLGAVERVVSSLIEAWGTMGGIFGSTNSHLLENNKQMGKSETLGDTLSRVFFILSEILNGYADNVQRVTGLLKTLMAVAAEAYNTIAGALGVAAEGINAGASAAAGNATGQTVTPPSNTAPKGIGNNNKTNIQVQVNIPAGVSPATATKIVTDGVLQAQRSRGMA